MRTKELIETEPEITPEMKEVLDNFFENERKIVEAMAEETFVQHQLDEKRRKARNKRKQFSRKLRGV